jgi:O-antigen/teichoic acid export membrane protein
MSIGKKITRNITANYFGVMGQITIAFFLSPFLVHTLGDTRYGVWTIIAALSGYMSLLDLGIASALTRYVAEHHQKKDERKINEIINSALFLFLAISIAIIVISPLFAHGIVTLLSFEANMIETVRTLVIIVSFDISIFVIAGIFRGTFGGFQRFDIINVARVGSMLYKAIVFYLFLSNDFGLLAMGLISVSANLLIAAFYYWQIKARYPFVKFNHKFVNKRNITTVFSYSKFVFIAMLAQQFLYYSSSFVVSYYISIAAVTYYAIPWTLSEYVKQLCIAISRTYTPAFTELNSAGDHAGIYHHYILGTKIVLIISNLLCTGILVLGTDFVFIWMGEAYAEVAASLFPILLITLYFFTPQLISYALLKSLDRHQQYSNMSILVSILSLALSILFVQNFGLTGVAAGSAIPQILFFGIYTPYFTCKVINKSYSRYILSTHGKLLAPTLLLGLVLFGLKNAFPPQNYVLLVSEAFAGALAYLLALYFFALSSEEQRITRQSLSNLSNRMRSIRS